VKGLILVRGARQLLTLHGPQGPRRGSALRDLGLVHDGSVLIRDGVIEEVGSSRRVENLSVARQAQEIDASGRVVMPGFVDSHTHAVFGVPWLKDFELRIAGSDVRDTATGYSASTQLIRKSSLKTLEMRTRRPLHAMVRHGTTTFEAKSGFGWDESGELKILRLLARLNRRPLDVVPTVLARLPTPEQPGGFPPPDPARHAGRVCAELLPSVSLRKLARFADVRCDPWGFGLEDAARVLETARSLGFLLKVHSDQFSRTGAVPLAVRLGAVSADHLDYLSAEDISLLAASETIATLCPGSALHLGCSRFAPARALIDAGAAVALATNFNPHTSPTCNMQMVVALACSCLGMTPGEAISAATINGAHALRCAGQVGSLELGKSADLLVLNASDYREIPYYFGVNCVHLTMKRGAVIYQENRVGPLPDETR